MKHNNYFINIFIFKIITYLRIFMKKIIIGFVMLFISISVYAEMYKVQVDKRIENNLYLISSGASKFLVNTRYCYEYATYENAILVYDDYHYDNKLIFEDGTTCEVDKLYNYD